MTANIESLVKTLSDRISGTGEVIVTAESLTGGMISAALTSVSGSSAWFERGFVTYTNEAKHQMLDVPQGILDRFTAVSAETVTHMLIGALKHSGASVAGPTGALPGKPVGTVFIGWMRRDEIAEVVRCQFDGDRAAVREQTVEKALNGLLGYFDERP